MAVIQFSLPTEKVIELHEQGKRLGLSENQVAKMMVLLGQQEFSDGQLIDMFRKANGAKKVTNVKPITSS